MAFLQVCRQQKIIWECATVASRRFLLTRKLSVSCKLCVQESNTSRNCAIWTCKNGLLDVFQGQKHHICLSTNNTFPLQQKVAQAHVDLPVARKQTGITGKKKKSAKKTKKKADKQIKEVDQISSNKSDKKNIDVQSAEFVQPSSKTTARNKKKKQSGKEGGEVKSSDKNKAVRKNAADTKLVHSGDQKGKGKVKQAVKKKKQSQTIEGDLDKAIAHKEDNKISTYSVKRERNELLDSRGQKGKAKVKQAVKKKKQSQTKEGAVDKAIAYKKDNKLSTYSVKRESNKPVVVDRVDKFRTSAGVQGNVINDIEDVNRSMGVSNNSTVLSDEHSLDYNLEAVLAETEDDLHGESELEGAHLPDVKGELGVDGVDTIKSNLEADSKHLHSGEAECGGESLAKTSVGLVDLDIHAQQQFGGMVQTPKKYREGTAGGRLFKAQTLAEIDGYLYLGKPNEAQKLFNRYLRMGKRFEVDTFNKLLHGWAQKGNLMSVKLLYNLLKQEELEPDMETYAALLHAYGTFSDSNGIRNVLNEMNEKLLDVKHIFYNCCLTEAQAKGVLHALKLVDPHYEPEVPETQRNLTYPSLVEPLYSGRPYCNITLLSIPGELEKELNEERLQNLLEEQISTELSGITNVKSVEEEQLESIEAHRNRKEMFLECRNVWRKALIESLEKELAEIKNAKGNPVHPRYAPFFQAFEPEELADITLDTVVFYVKGRIEGVPLNGVSGAVGSALNTKYIVKHRVQSGMLDKMKEIYHDYFSYLMDEKLTARKMAREFWDELDDSLPYGASLQQEVPSWPWATKIVFGCALVDCFLKSAMINVNLFNNRPEKVLPAFYHTYEFKVNKKFGVLKPHPIVCKLFKGYLASQGEISMETTSIPMLVPPRPWRAAKDGAYLILPVELIRSAGDEDGRYDKLLEEKTNKQDLVSVFDSLNFLGACAWKTNQRILDIAIQLFNSGGNEDLTIPGPVIYPKADSKSFKSTTDPEERKKKVRERRIATKLAREQYSLRMSALYKLSVANHFRDQVFWLPINLDFRGRVYPIPPHCAHVGDDLNRGMLQFAKGVPLGERGLDWLKVHLVTLHGAQKKASLKERLEYANKIMDEILDSADNPLTGRCWWKTADDPWQTLSTCMEVADAVRSPDPTQFVSYQPVHQDGSCNGLQHYAALGRDRYGAKQVNLVPADRPQDVYEEVAKLVEVARLRDAAAGNEIAIDLEGKVSRKVVKQTVMTIVYGVTFVGGRLQIERQLKDLDMDEKSVFKASTYLVTKVFASIGEMFTAARAIQNWFASSATQIALSGHYVDWYTPLGLYVSQPYSRKAPTKVLKTKLQWMLIKAKGLPHIPPDSRKQRGAFPPNFVHSLDSTHMMLTALFCQRSGATFSSVHDSFWTHAANVDIMNQICRQQFVALHSEPVLQELQKHFQKNYSDLKLARPLKLKETGEERTHVSFEGLPEPGNPHTGDFDIKEVLESVYFFS